MSPSHHLCVVPKRNSSIFVAIHLFHCDVHLEYCTIIAGSWTQWWWWRRWWDRVCDGDDKDDNDVYFFDNDDSDVGLVVITTKSLTLSSLSSIPSSSIWTKRLPFIKVNISSLFTEMEIMKVININGVACWCSRPRWDRKYKSRTLLNQFHHLDYPSFLS